MFWFAALLAFSRVLFPCFGKLCKVCARSVSDGRINFWDDVRRMSSKVKVKVKVEVIGVNTQCTMNNYEDKIHCSAYAPH
jgi:predicted DNA-binding protein with PD1-like motif